MKQIRKLHHHRRFCRRRQPTHQPSKLHAHIHHVTSNQISEQVRGGVVPLLWKQLVLLQQKIDLPLTVYGGVFP